MRRYAEFSMAVKLDTPVKPAELIEEYRHGFHDPENYVFKSDKGLTREIVERISAMTANWSLGPLVEALRGLRGIDLLSAATFVATTGDLSRFESPRQLMATLGVVPPSTPAAPHAAEAASRKPGMTRPDEC